MFFLNPAPAEGQDSGHRLPYTAVALADLSAFKTTGANWRIAGNANADRNAAGDLSVSPGVGILANLMDAGNRAPLLSRFEHGDLELELEVLMAKGANSGIYLQGRYEVQLLDSWGKESLSYGDMGGIYQRTDPVTQKGYEGYAPLVNACRAPGLWQKIYIHFKAPEFDDGGKKIADARFITVSVNGVVVQKDIAVSGPTRSGAYTDEQPYGPLMIQGNHGKIAVRNIRYKLYNRKKVTLHQMTCTEYPTPGDSLRSFAPRNAGTTTQADSLSWRREGAGDTFLLLFRGEMQFPEKGDYLFSIQTGGGGMLVVGGDTVLVHDGANPFDRVAAGRYRVTQERVPFELIYNKPLQWREGLALYAEGPGMEMHPLHSKGSVFKEPPVAPVLIRIGKDKAEVQRSFVNTGKEKKTHCISVGTPQGTHFSIDLETGSLLQVWDGGFLDATPMWHRRGNQQVAVPLGPVIAMKGDHGFSKAEGEPLTLQLKSYVLDREGLPEFFYTGDGLEVSDKLVPGKVGRSLERRLKVRARQPYVFRVASGTVIEQLPGGDYLVNDKEYYLRLKATGNAPVLRANAEGQEILLRAGGNGVSEIAYVISW
ncbi:hypothetical protein GCM10023091_16570 [Ravibacter arvi]|uniref:3-keto-alpha-glucoside-1,2-lyase/3-keto-2-hydroxy-glucal hydratase domain-containing protein n=1 Tax=Ravibacter arvi TaxID=2051041 RepID=A0ABP8LXX7_9BACT